MTPSATETPQRVPEWTAAAVARRLGVAPATLRSWSARYGIGPADHRRGRYRRYTDADVDELTTMRQLHAEGVPMATAAGIARSRRRDGTAGDPVDDRWPEVVGDVVHAVRDLDGSRAVRALHAAFTDAGVVATWNRLCRPALVEVSADTGDAGPQLPGGPAHDDDPDTECVDTECVLTWAITTALRRLPTLPPMPTDHHALLACASGELHTLALEALHAALEELRVPARMLGPSVPTPALRHATERTAPVVVVVWAQTPATADTRIVTALRDHAPVVAAGPGWDPATLTDGARAATGLEQAISYVTHGAPGVGADPGRVRSRRGT